MRSTSKERADRRLLHRGQIAHHISHCNVGGGGIREHEEVANDRGEGCDELRNMVLRLRLSSTLPASTKPKPWSLFCHGAKTEPREPLPPEEDVARAAGRMLAPVDQRVHESCFRECRNHVGHRMMHTCMRATPSTCTRGNVCEHEHHREWRQN
eukprot:COSAG02_NODE_4045_length_5865_cov_5.416233_2_plen_154_part_00